MPNISGSFSKLFYFLLSLYLSLSGSGFADTLAVSCRLRSLTLPHPPHIHTIVLSFLWPFSTLYCEALFFSRRFIRLFFYTVFGAASTPSLFGVPASSRVLHFSPNNKWKMSARRVLQTAAEAPGDFCSYIYKMHYCVAQAKSSTRNIPPKLNFADNGVSKRAYSLVRVLPFTFCQSGIRATCCSMYFSRQNF